MRYRTLGHSGVKVSSIALGSWLTYGSSVQRDVARACVRRAYDLGVNFFDTANVYARGAAEEVLAPIIAELFRPSVFLATKVYFPMGLGPNERGLSRKHIFEAMHASLRRLAVDYVDLYQCHRYDVQTPIEETCEAMSDLVRQGKTLYWGVSEWNADQIAHAVNVCRARGWSVPISNQPQYSALWRRIEDRVLPVCEGYGLGNVVFSPLAMGILSGKYTSARNPPPGTRAAGDAKDFMEDYFTQPVLDAVQNLKPIAQEAGCSMAQLSLAWCLRQRAVCSVIVGATKVEHVEENVVASDIDLSPQILREIDRVLLPVAPSEPFTS